jgi:hypothetical protein
MASRGGRTKQDKSMTSSGGRTTLVVSGILLLILLVVVALIPVNVPDAAGGAAVLAMVTAGAVAIERALESFWTMVGSSRLGNWWPLKPIGDRLNTFIDQLNEPLTSFYKEAQTLVQGDVEPAENVSPWLDTPDNYLGELETNIRKLQRLAPGDDAAQTMAAKASRAVVGLQKHYPDLQSYATGANKVLAGVNEFVQTFEDNPARRLMSLYASVVLGLLAAGILGLDAIQAVFGGVPSGRLAGKAYAWLPGIGAAVTGLAMGAGATPAHELIKALKEVKQRNKARA